MMRNTLLAVATLLSLAACQRAAEPAVPAKGANAQSRVLQVPLGFEANRGQVDHQVDYLARGPGYSLFLTASEAVFSLVPSAQASQSTVLRLSLIGANKTPSAQGVDKQAGVSHYLTGTNATRNVERFGKVRYTGVYPGIDVVYYGNQRELEYDFVLAPGADPKRIGLRFGGTHGVKLDASGNLVLSTDGGDVVQHKPIAYQTIDGQRRAVDSHYRVSADNSVAFEVGTYDRTQALVIDPVVVYRAPFGGAGTDEPQSIAVDEAGNTYVTGYTDSLDFPVSDGAPQPERAGGNDAFVGKLNTAGDGFVYTTYLGGSGEDAGRGITVDADGNVTVAGETASPDFPVVDALQPELRGDYDAFVARLSTDGSALVYSTYLGGDGNDKASAVALGVDGSAYVAGTTTSVDFPVSDGVVQPELDGASGGFVAKVDAQGSIAYATYAMGDVSTIAVDHRGNAYYGGSASDLVKLSPAADELLLQAHIDNTLFGIRDIVLDDEGNAYVLTSEVTRAFTPFNTDLTVYSSGGVVCKLQASTETFAYCAFVTEFGDIGMGVTQAASSIAVDDEGGVFVTGYTNRTRSLVSSDAFVQSITPSGRQQRDFTLVGSVFPTPRYRRQRGSAITVDAHGNAWVAGAGVTDGSTEPSTAFVARVLASDWKIVAAGDTDGDGRADLLWHHAGLEQLDGWRMNGAARVGVRSASIPMQYRVAGTGDFNGDGRTDVLWIDDARTSVWIWEAQADGSFAIKFVGDYPPTGWKVAGVGDVDGDGRADLLWHNRQMEELDWWLMDGAQVRAVGGQYVPSQYSVAQVADFTGDHRADLVWQDDARTTLWLWQADVYDFAIHFIDDYPPVGWRIVGAGDLDGDHRADLLWHNPGLQQLDWWTMHGAARVATGSKYIPSMYRVDAVGDFDGDHRADIVWRDDDRTSLWLWRAVPNDFAIQFIAAHPTSPR